MSKNMTVDCRGWLAWSRVLSARCLLPSVVICPFSSLHSAAYLWPWLVILILLAALREETGRDDRQDERRGQESLRHVFQLLAVSTWKRHHKHSHFTDSCKHAMMRMILCSNPRGVVDGFLHEAWIQVQRKGIFAGPYFNEKAAARRKAEGLRRRAWFIMINYVPWISLGTFSAKICVQASSDTLNSLSRMQSGPEK